MLIDSVPFHIDKGRPSNRFKVIVLTIEDRLLLEKRQLPTAKISITEVGCVQWPACLTGIESHNNDACMAPILASLCARGPGARLG